jgi:hypothetical protein
MHQQSLDQISRHDQQEFVNITIKHRKISAKVINFCWDLVAHNDKTIMGVWPSWGVCGKLELAWRVRGQSTYNVRVHVFSVEEFLTSPTRLYQTSANERIISCSFHQTYDNPIIPQSWAARRWCLIGGLGNQNWDRECCLHASTEIVAPCILRRVSSWCLPFSRKYLVSYFLKKWQGILWKQRYNRNSIFSLGQEWVANLPVNHSRTHLFEFSLAGKRQSCYHVYVAHVSVQKCAQFYSLYRKVQK